MVRFLCWHDMKHDAMEAEMIIHQQSHKPSSFLHSGKIMMLPKHTVFTARLWKFHLAVLALRSLCAMRMLVFLGNLEKESKRIQPGQRRAD